jgi:NAD(P)-dependent dehydrogenase (short-subunit alcohol dehydrogenase family)
VNVVAPGLIQTDMTENIGRAPGFDIKSRIPAGRIGTLADTGAAVVFLASDAPISSMAKFSPWMANGLHANVPQPVRAGDVLHRQFRPRE